MAGDVAVEGDVATLGDHGLWGLRGHLQGVSNDCRERTDSSHTHTHTASVVHLLLHYSDVVLYCMLNVIMTER